MGFVVIFNLLAIDKLCVDFTMLTPMTLTIDINHSSYL